ncbi:hypothetical protein D3C77_683340 [compost metagenome]
MMETPPAARRCPLNRTNEKAPRCGAFRFSRGSILAVATQLQGLAGDASVLELAEQTVQTVFRQFDQAEGFADLDTADGLTSQTAFVEDRAEQVLGGDAVAGTQ